MYFSLYWYFIFFQVGPCLQYVFTLLRLINIGTNRAKHKQIYNGLTKYYYIVPHSNPYTIRKAIIREWSTSASTFNVKTSSPSITPEHACFCFTCTYAKLTSKSPSTLHNRRLCTELSQIKIERKSNNLINYLGNNILMNVYNSKSCFAGDSNYPVLLATHSHFTGYFSLIHFVTSFDLEPRHLLALNTARTAASVAIPTSKT